MTTGIRSRWNVAALLAPIVAAIFVGSVVWVDSSAKPAATVADPPSNALIIAELQKTNAQLALINKSLSKKGSTTVLSTPAPIKVAPVAKAAVHTTTGASGAAPP